MALPRFVIFVRKTGCGYIIQTDRIGSVMVPDTTLTDFGYDDYYF